MSLPATHQMGRSALAAAWPLVTGREATLPELQIAGAIAAHESNYGLAAYRNELTGESFHLNNWGAIHCSGSAVPPCDSDCVEVTESSPTRVTPDNPLGHMQACMQAYASPTDGARVFVKAVTLRRPTVWAGMQAGDIDETIRAMHDDRPIYFEGFGATAAIQKAGYAGAVDKLVQEIASAMGEVVAARRGGPSFAPGGGDWTDAGTCVSVLILGFFAREILGRYLP